MNRSEKMYHSAGKFVIKKRFIPPCHWNCSFQLCMRNVTADGYIVQYLNSNFLRFSCTATRPAYKLYRMLFVTPSSFYAALWMRWIGWLCQPLNRNKARDEVRLCEIFAHTTHTHTNFAIIPQAMALLQFTRFSKRFISWIDDNAFEALVLSYNFESFFFCLLSIWCRWQCNKKWSTKLKCLFSLLKIHSKIIWKMCVCVCLFFIPASVSV